tara:strand:- start:3855 stop:4184 length:330 start_codon:yes stop_codon:yes gene_type:complete
MHRVKIKPLSVNGAWQGKRFKTPAYKQYEKDMMSLLPKTKMPEGKFNLYIQFGLSSKNADVDNPVKCFVDCLQKKYGFNDRNIYGMVIEKVDVKKGDEFICFETNEYEG